MKSITNTQAPAIIEDIVRAHHHLPGRVPCRHGQQFAQHHSVHHRRGRRRGAQGAFHGQEEGLRTLTRQRSIRTGKDGEYFTFAGHTFHAWQFQTWEEHADIMDDFFTHYRIRDSHVPNVHQSQGRGGSPRVRGRVGRLRAVVVRRQHGCLTLIHNSTKETTMRLFINNLTPEYPDPEDESYWDFMADSLQHEAIRRRGDAPQ